MVSTDVASSAVSVDRQETATSIIISGYPAGCALGQLGASRLAEVVGWPGVFPFAISIGMMGAIIVWLMDESGNPTRET